MAEKKPTSIMSQIFSCCIANTWKTQGPAGESSQLQIPSTASLNSEFSLLHPKAQVSETQSKSWWKDKLSRVDKNTRHAKSVSQKFMILSFQRADHCRFRQTRKNWSKTGITPWIYTFCSYMGRVIYSTGIWLLTGCQTLFAASGIYCLPVLPSRNLIYFYFL